MTVINTRNAETINIDTNGTYDVARYTTANVSVGGGYNVLDRVKDDSDNDIGCVVGFHTDANNQKYAVVCINKQYRPADNTCQYLSSNTEVIGIPLYMSNMVWEAPETATFNCDKILAQATADNLTSSAVSVCRGISFVIGGTTYYGQLPTIFQLVNIMQLRTKINNSDPSQTGTNIGTGYAWSFWSSTQRYQTQAWQIGTNGNADYTSKTQGRAVVPVLEIPIQ